MARMQDKMERVRASGWSAIGAAAAGFGPSSSGNRAFDDYRAETLKRLEDEQREFKEFLERLRFAKDRAEFDQFMARTPPASVRTDRRRGRRKSRPTTELRRARLQARRATGRPPSAGGPCYFRATRGAPARSRGAREKFAIYYVGTYYFEFAARVLAPKALDIASSS